MAFPRPPCTALGLLLLLAFYKWGSNLLCGVFKDHPTWPWELYLESILSRWMEASKGREEHPATWGHVGGVSTKVVQS